MCVIHVFRLLNLHASICHKTRAPMAWLNTPRHQRGPGPHLDASDNETPKSPNMVHYYTIYTCACHLCSFPKFFDISNY